MPHHCIVEGCKNNSKKSKNLSFHKLPLSKPKLLQVWLKRMKHFDTVNEHTKICSAHFEGGVRKSFDDIPTVFPWTIHRAPPKNRSDTTEKNDTLRSPNMTANSLPNTPLSSDPLECPFAPEHLPATPTSEACHSAALQTSRELVGDPTRYVTHNDIIVPEQQTKATNTDKTYYADKLTQTKATNTDKLTQTKVVPSISIENISGSDKLMHLYTGFPDFPTFKLCFDLLGPSVDNLRYFNNVQKSSSKAGAPRTLSPINEFILVLCRLRLHLIEDDLAFRFKISQSSVSRIFITWINFLYYKFKELDIWPSRNQVNHYMPRTFKEDYPTTRCIIDATEIYIEKPSSPVAQQLTFSSYKNCNTLKALIGITPSGAISFISDLYGGCISDRQLTIKSGILDKMEVGDSIMADKGFLIADLLEPLGVSLNIPPLKLTEQLSNAQLLETRRIASLRVHVERAIGRLKTFRILSNPIPNTMSGVINQVFFVCSILTNFRASLVV